MEERSPQDLEHDLGEQLATCRLVCELGLEGELYKGIVRTMASLAAGGTPAIDRLCRNFPALLISYLVAEGIHSYEAGTYWGKLTIPILRAHQGSLGPQFEEALGRLHLDDFDELLEEERAQRYVSRILVHGGIPRYSLSDFFSLLLSSLKGGSSEAADLVAVWRSRKTRFQGIDKPVERFLLRGGEVALDLLNRCIEMVLEEARTGTVPSADELGLPAYVVQAYVSMPVIERQSARVATATSFPRPKVELDPWDPFGPRIHLPAVTEDLRDAEWRLNDGARLVNIRARTDRTERAMLQPAFSWSVGLWRGYELIREFTFEALEEMPLLLFDPSNGRLVASRQILRLESVWALHPDGTLGLTTDRAGSLPVPVREEFPDPAGAWHGYIRRHYDLSGVPVVFVQREGSDARMIRVVTPNQRPRLVAEAVGGVTTAEGYLVYPAFPHLEVPPVDRIAAAKWRLSLRSGNESTQTTLDRVPSGGDDLYDLQPLLAGTEAGVFGVTLRGPLGSDVRDEFAVIPDLVVDRPSWPLLPSDGPSQIRLTASVPSPHSAWEGVLEVPEDADEATISIPTDDVSTLRLRVTVPRVMWSIDRSDDPRSIFGNRILGTATEEISEGIASALSVRTRLPGIPVTLALTDGDHLLQTSDTEQTSGAEGRWTFELAPFAGTLRASTAPVLSFELGIAGRREPVARVFTRLSVHNLAATVTMRGARADVELTFEENRPLRGRVARLWPLDRPWLEPEATAVPDDARGTAVLEDVVVGRYLAEIGIEDEWIASSRPALWSANTQMVTIGDSDEIATHAGALDLASPLSVLEAAVVSTRPLRPLTPHEVREIAPAGMEVLSLLLEERGHRAMASRAFGRVTDLLLELPDALVEAFAAFDGPPLLALKAGICLLLPVRNAAPKMTDAVLRALWSRCPPLAAVLETPLVWQDDSAAARSEEALGWPSQDGQGQVLPGGPVALPFEQMRREQLSVLRREMNLTPRRWLDGDFLAGTYLDWLDDRCDHPEQVDAWCRDYQSLLFESEELPRPFREAVAMRRPVPQAPRWFAFPQITLVAALHLVHETAIAEHAAGALVDAAAHAQRLVTRDLLLACVLNEALKGRADQ
jgi:hypothetical protein